LIEQLPQWFQIFLFSMIPGFESRFAIPIIAVNQFGWEWWKALPFAIAGNMFLVPFGLLFLHKIEKNLRKISFFKNAMDIIFPKIRRRANKKIQKYEYFALIFFVAVPLPFTGAGLGVLIAYLFDLKFSRSLIMIFIGVILSALLVMFIYLTGNFLIFYNSS
jgi:uncharacterized membrane protein